MRSASPGSLPAVVGESTQLWMLIKNVSSTTLPLIYITAAQVSACKHRVSPLPVKCKSISAQQTVQWTPSAERRQPTCVFYFLDAVNTQRDLFIKQVAKPFSVKQKQMFSLTVCIVWMSHSLQKGESWCATRKVFAQSADAPVSWSSQRSACFSPLVGAVVGFC